MTARAKSTEKAPVKAADSAVDAPKDQRPASESKKTCNVPGCKQDPEFRGLCGAHWMTHRGLADPKEQK